MSEPFPEPNSSLPSSITGSMEEVPLRKAPAANRDDPITHNEENRNTPTATKRESTSIILWLFLYI